MRIEIGREIHVFLCPELVSDFSDLGMFLLECFAPFSCQASMFIIRAQVALVPRIVTAHPADEWIWQLVFFTPVTEPASAGPAQVEIAEQAIVYIKSHGGVATHASCEPLTTDPLDLLCAAPEGTPQPNTYAFFIGRN